MIENETLAPVTAPVADTTENSPPIGSPAGSLWRHPDFMKLWTGQTVSLFGTLLTRVALPFIAVLILGANAAQMAILTGLRVVPALLLGLVAGQIVDRVSRRKVMLLADLGRAATLLCVPVAFALHALRLEYLFVVMAVVSALDVFFDVAYPAYLPTVVGREQLLEGNTKLEASGAVSEVAGFSLAGVITQALSAPLALIVDAGTYLVSAVSLLFIRRPEPHIAASKEQPRERGAIWQGLRAVVGHPVRRALAGYEGLREMASLMVSSVFFIFVARDLALQPALLGAIFAVGGVASFAGTLLVGRVTRRHGLGRVIVGAAALTMLLGFSVPLAFGPVWLLAVFLVAQQLSDGFATIAIVDQASLLQAITPDAIQGRVHGAIRLISSVTMLFGIALGGVLGELIGARGALFVACGIELLAVLWLALSPIRQLRAMPTEVE
jgi:MFS family permease